MSADQKKQRPPTASLEKLTKRLKKYSESDSSSSMIAKKAERTFLQLQSLPPLSAQQLGASGLPAIVNRLRKRLRPEEAAARTARLLIKTWRLTVESERHREDSVSTSSIEHREPSPAQSQRPGHSNPTSQPVDNLTKTSAPAVSDKHSDDSWTPHTNEPIRLKGVEMLQQALQLQPSSSASSASASTQGSSDGVVLALSHRRLAADIEAAVSADSSADPARYRARLRCLLQNLRDPKNPELRASLLAGHVTPAQFAVMTSEQLASAEMRRLRQQLAEDSTARLKSATSASSEPGSSLFTCKRCRKNNCTYNQLQTLSGDEPMTTYLFCYECGFRWKFN